jgi:glycosyltransferase involved in cell wall biosynthesis
MKVTHVSAAKGIAGSEGHLLKLLPGLKAAGVDVDMVVLGRADKSVGFVERMKALNVPVTRLPMARHLSPKIFTQLVRHFQNIHPDIVHTHLIHADIYGTAAARTARVAHVITSRHNIDHFRKLIPLRAASYVMWRLVDGGITISDAVKEFAYRVEPSSRGKLRTIHYGFQPMPDNPDGARRRTELRNEWGVRPDGLVIGSISRLIEQKGLRYALEAFTRVREQIPAAHYVIAGDGSLRQELTEHANRLSLNESIRFLGWQDRADELYDAFDVFLMPSLWEGFGLTLLEAMAHRLPIITTNVTAMPEIVIDGETGYLVKPADSEALVEPLIRLLRDHALKDRMGQAGRARLESSFTVEKMVSKTVEFYGAMMQDTRP